MKRFLLKYGHWGFFILAMLEIIRGDVTMFTIEIAMFGALESFKDDEDEDQAVT